MSITLTFRTDDGGRWGTGKGSNLTAAEVDINIWNLAQAIEAVMADIPAPVTIASVSRSGTDMSFVMSDASIIGPIPLPVLTFRYLGAWQANFTYAVLDTFFVSGQGIFTTEIAHTSGSTFDPDIQVVGSPALLQLFGATGTELLSGLADVRVESPTDGDFFVYDGGSIAQWVNISEANAAGRIAAHIALDNLSDVSAAAPSSGQVLTWSGAAWVPATPSGGGGGSATTLSALLDVELTSTLAPGDVLTFSGDGHWISRAVAIVELADVSIDSTITDGDVLTWHQASGRWIASPPTGGVGGTASGADFLSQLGDVDVGSPIADGDVLTWDETTNHWVPQGLGSLSGGGGSFTDKGTWNTSDGFDPFDVVQRDVSSIGTKAFLCWNTVTAAAATPPSVGESANTTFGGTGGTVSLTTTAAGEVVVFILLNQSSARNVVSVVGGTLGSFTKRGGGPLNWNADGAWVGDLEEWHATSSGALSSENITITTDFSVDCAAVIAFNVIGYTDFDADGSLPVNVNTATLAYATSNAADLLLYASGAEGNGNYQDVPAGFTQIDAVIDGSHGLRFASLRVSYKVVTTLDSNGAFGGASGANFVNFFDAIAGVGAENTAPEDDPGHWIGG